MNCDDDGIPLYFFHTTTSCPIPLHRFGRTSTNPTFAGLQYLCHSRVILRSSFMISPCQKTLFGSVNCVCKLATFGYIICRHCWCWRRMIEDGKSFSAKKARTWTNLNTLKQQKSHSAINYTCDCPSIYSNIAMYQCVTCIIVKEVTYRVNPGLECNVLLV